MMERLKNSPALAIALCVLAGLLLVWQIRRSTAPTPALSLKDMPATIRDDTTPPRPGYVPVQGAQGRPGVAPAGK